MSHPRPVVLLCGLGARAPGETTLEVLQALRGAAVVYTDVDEPSLRRWLRARCRRLEDAPSPERIFERSLRDGAVAVAVQGHPALSSALGLRVLRASRPGPLGVRVLGAVSPIASAFARSVSFLGGDYGFQHIQAFDLEALEAGAQVDPRAPLVVYSLTKAAPERWRRACASLAARRPPGPPALVLGARAGTESGPLQGLRFLGARGTETLFVPPAPGPRGAA